MKRKNLLAKAVALALGANIMSFGMTALPNVEHDFCGAHVSRIAEAAEDVAPANRSVVVVGNIQSKIGGTGDWEPGGKISEMKYVGHGLYSFTCNLPEGNYFYKIAINGSWAENYGLNGNFDGRNLQLQLDAPAQITFYYNDITHKIKESTQYTPLAQEELPVISGSFGSVILQDLTLDEFYQENIELPAGTYDVEISQKGQETVSKTFTVRNAGQVKVYFDGKTKAFIADDGSIHEDKILHDSWDNSYRSNFEAIKAGESVEIGLRTGEGEVNQPAMVLYKSDIVNHGGDEYNIDYFAGSRQMISMEKVKTEGGFDYWNTKVTPQSAGIYGYKFILDNVKEYGDDAKSGHIGEAALRNAKPFQLTVYSADYHTPDWAKEAVTYQIFPDRFFNGDKSNDYARDTARATQKVRHMKWSDIPSNNNPDPNGEPWTCNDFFGGDLAGITQKLDYLKDMGFTAIYVNPIMSASSNHRYDARNYEMLDPFLGDMKAFDTLVEEMNKRGMRLIMDGVFNHVGDDSIYFDRYGKYDNVGAYEYWSRVYDLMNEKKMNQKDAEKEARKQLVAEGQKFSKFNFENWFEISNRKTSDEYGEHYAYRDWEGFSSLCPFKDVVGGKNSPVPNIGDQLNNKDLANYLIYDKDAIITRWFRNGISGWRLDVAHEVSPNFWRAVRKTVKQIKTKNGDEPLLLGEIWQDASQFLSGDQFDSAMNYKLSFAIGDLFLNRGEADKCDEELKILRQNYPREAVYDMMNIVDSHDTYRAIYKFGGGKEEVKQPTLNDFDYNLGKARLMMSVAFLMGYPGMPTIYYGDEAGQYGSVDPDCRRTFPWGKEDKELQNFYKKAIAARNNNKNIFVYGDVDTLKAEGDVYAFARTNGDSLGVVVLNRGKASDVALDVKAQDGTVFTDALDESYNVTARNGKLIVAMGENKARMLIKK